MKTVRPPEGFPWEQPGYRFWEPGFPPMFTPTLADELISRSPHDGNASKSERATKERQKRIDAGTDMPFGGRSIVHRK